MLRSPLGALLAPIALAAVPTAWQEPKPGGEWYEDEVHLGFKVKAPKDWAFTPGSPLDENVIGKYAPRNGEGVGLGGDAGVFVNVWLLRFDRRNPRKEENAKGEEAAAGARDIRAWMNRGIDKGIGWRLLDGWPEPLKGPDLPAESFVFEGMSTESIRAYAGARVRGVEAKPIRCYVAVFRLEDGLEVALAGVGPGEKKWHSYEKAFEALARTFAPIPITGAPKSSAPAGTDPRSLKRAKLEGEMARTPGWSMLETENYFVVSNATDAEFLAEVQERIEALRKVFLLDYPPEKARLVTREKKKEPSATEKEPDAERTVAPVRVDTLAASRSSVVRVCANEEQYIQYGGSPGAPGYWYSAAEELVLYDDRAGGGRADTWVVLNHEAFHQYIYYFYGNIAPHSWYNEGTGDFYSGYEYDRKRKRFELTENPWRIRGIQEMLRQGVASPEKKDFGYVPLKELVRWTQPQYYGANPVGLPGYKVYAEGWSLIYFLRTGAKNKAKGWDPAWGTILDRYLDTLATSGQLDKAVDAAFAGVDWARLEESWKDYIL
jgi:hypothetical protein